MIMGYIALFKNMAQSSPHPSQPSSPVPAVTAAAQQLKTLTGLDFSLSPDGRSLDYEGPVTIPAFDRLYDLGERGAVTANITYSLHKSANGQKLSVTAFDPDRLAKLCEAEPERKTQGEAAALLLSRLTNKVWVFDGLCVSTKTPPEGDALFKQLEIMKNNGVLPSNNAWNILNVTVAGDQAQSFLSLHDIDISRLRAIAPSLQSAGHAKGLGR